MAGLTRVRAALATAASAVLTEWSWPYAPDMSPPNVGPIGAMFVIVDPSDTVIERATFDRGYFYRVRCRVLVGGASDKERQERLDDLVSPDGAASLWRALEATPEDGEIEYVQVNSVTGYGELDGQAEGVVILAADLIVEVMVSHV